MAVEQYALFRLVGMPTIEAIQSAATALGYDLAVDFADLWTHTGFLPATLGGVATGFEVSIELLEDIDGRSEGLDPIWTHACATRTGGDLREAAAATVFLRAFVECTHGGYWYPDDEIYRDPREAAAFLDDQIGQFKSLLARAR